MFMYVQYTTSIYIQLYICTAMCIYKSSLTTINNICVVISIYYIES